MDRRLTPLSQRDLTALQDRKAELAEEMASTGLYFVKWTAAGLGLGVLATAVLRLRGGRAYVPMLALGSVGSIVDFAEAHRTTQPLREQMAIVGSAIDRPNDSAARGAAVEAGVLPSSAMTYQGEGSEEGAACDRDTRA